MVLRNKRRDLYLCNVTPPPPNSVGEINQQLNVAVAPNPFDNKTVVICLQQFYVLHLQILMEELSIHGRQQYEPVRSFYSRYGSGIYCECY